MVPDQQWESIAVAAIWDVQACSQRPALLESIWRLAVLLPLEEVLTGGAV